MRVLLTTDTIGGVWTFTADLTLELLERDHAVALVSLGRQPSAAQSAWCERMLSLYPERFLFLASDAPLEWMPQNDSAYSSAAPLLLEVAARFRPDVLHSSQFCFGRLPLSVPRLVTAHSDVLSWAAACRPEGLEPSPWLDQYKLLVQQGIDGADALAAPTHWMRDALAAGFAVHSSARVVPNGRTFATSEPSQAPRKLQAVSAGRLWDEAKGLATLLSLNAPMPLLIAGEDAPEPAQDAAGVQLLGVLSESALFALFRTSSVYIAASLYEPFGLAPLEAALCGCAILARDLPSLREVWGDSALYFNDQASLEALLQQLAQSPAQLERQRLRAEAQAARYTASAMAESYLALYRELIEGAPAHGGQYAQELALHAA